MKRSGKSLVICGLLGLLFFWLTDPRFGLVRAWGASANLVDDAHKAIASTLLGLVASLAVLVLGLWLMSRQAS